ncbi:MAG: ATP-binding protein [Bacteroidia bacterium]
MVQKILFEDAIPNPEYLIKSIAEQGYSLETSLADLMDNSISANADKIEILIKMNEEPFTLFLADNGEGMDCNSLRDCMKFPSNSPEAVRDQVDLGRFGLGMKTASFAQTRSFTVISKKKGDTNYSARTWDVGCLKKEGWKIIVNTESEIKELITTYQELSEAHLNKFNLFEANTIVVWKGLYKFENYLDESNRKIALQREITEVTSEHLSVVFHRFMERQKKPLLIRVNNIILKPFNPFPTKFPDFRSIEYKQRNFREDTIKMEGFVLPSRSIDETKQGLSEWTTTNRSLTDMEGIYIYRSDRLIRFGDWNGIIKKSPRMQLARLKVEVGNNVDHLLHLNVAKSQITIPYDLKQAFLRYIIILKDEAEKEFFNRGINTFAGAKKEDKINLFSKVATNKGVMLEMNKDFPLLSNLKKGLNKGQQLNLDILIRMVNNSINKIKHFHEDKQFTGVELQDGVSLSSLKTVISDLLTSGVAAEQIKENIIPLLGFTYESLPDELKQTLKRGA